MDVLLGQTRVRLKDGDLVGEGGEARVFRIGRRAVKVFHAIDPASARDARARAMKLEKLSRFPPGLPPNVLGPLELARSVAGEVLGFSMHLVEGAESVNRLGHRRFREAHVPNDRVTSLFRTLHETLSTLHRTGVVVGDLNDGNVLVRPESNEVFLIDADAMQFAGLPCVVAHERFLDPRLYGVDLGSSPRFDEGTDWFAYAVMLFSSWLYVHPFGGTHPRLGTMLRRAEARHSILRDDVVAPRVAASWRTLSDGALHWFSGVFERDERRPPPRAVLEASFTRCRCGVEHARAACPVCHALGPHAATPAVRARGRCVAKVIRKTSGRVVAAALQGGVRYALEEAGRVVREDGAVVLPRPLLPTEHLAIAGSSTWLATSHGTVERLVQGSVTERTQTGVRGRAPVLAASATSLYRLEDEWLIEHESGGRIGQVLDGQTWLWTGERLGLGFYRAGGVTVAFLFRVGRAGLKRLPDLTWTGRLVSAEAVFDARHALLSLTLEQSGRDVVHRWLLSDDGVLLAKGVGGRPGHAAVLGGHVVLGTDDGLVTLGVDRQQLVERACFADTQPFVSAQDELLPQSDGSLVVVGSTEVGRCRCRRSVVLSKEVPHVAVARLLPGQPGVPAVPRARRAGRRRG